MKKTAEWIADITLLIAFTSSTLASVLDLIGVFDLSALWGGQIVPEMLKVSLMLIGALGSVLIFERRLLLNKFAQEIDQVSEDTVETRRDSHNTLEVLEDIKRNWAPTRIYNTREGSYSSFARALERAPNGSHVYVTHFEKYRGATYDVGEIEAEKNLVEKWTKRITQGEIFARQIVHVCSTFDLSEVEDRIERFEKASNFSLNVMYGPPIRPFLDLVVIRNHWAMLHISANPMSPFEADVGLTFTNPEMIDAFERYFDIWWSRFSVSIKDRDGRKPESIRALHDLLPKETAESWLDQTIDLSLRLAQNKRMLELFNNIAEHLSALKEIPVADVFQKAAINAIIKCRDEVGKISNASFKLDDTQSVLILLRIFDEAKTQIHAVSYAFQQEKFWASGVGRRLLRANYNANRRGIEITRIFILSTKQDIQDVRNIIKQHKATGVKVLFVKAAELPDDLLGDYLIQDNRLIFHMGAPTKGGMLENCWISIDDKEVQRMRYLFNRLLLRANEV